MFGEQALLVVVCEAGTQVYRDDTGGEVVALDSVDLVEHLDRPARFLSGGQQQRLALARALAGGRARNDRPRRAVHQA